MNLRILDLSTYIHHGGRYEYAIIAGGVRKTSNGYEPLELNSSGIAFLMKDINKYRRDKIIIACDREPQAKRDMMPEYKWKREEERDQSIEQQKRIAELIAKDCGFEVIYKDRFEADDIIYSMVKKYYNDFDHIYLHLTDGDLFCLIDDKVSVGKVGDNGKEIDIHNYEYTVKANKVVPYNTMSIYKMIHGDPSDSIHALPRGVGNKVKQVLQNSVESCKMCGERDYVISMLEFAVPAAVDQAKIIYPLSVDVKSNPYKEYDPKRFEVWGYVVGCSEFMSPSAIPPDIKEIIASFFKEE